MVELLKVTNDAGRVFNVRVVRQGDGYGVEDRVVHTHADPLVEFYDATYEGPKFGPRGQFVSRYYLSTLAEFHNLIGLNLNGGVPDWNVSAANVNAAVNFAGMVPANPGEK